MGRRVKLNLALGLTILALAAVLLNGSGPRQPATAGAGSVNIDNPQLIELRHLDGRRIRFQRGETHWFMTEPLTVAANPLRIDTLLSLASPGRFTRLENNRVPFDRLGLEPATLEVSLGQDNFAFGNREPLQGQRYLAWSKDLYLVPENLFQQLRQPYTFFIDLQLLPRSSTIVGLQTRTGSYQLREGSWLSGDDRPVDNQAELQSLATRLQQLRARQVQEATNVAGGQRLSVAFADGSTVLCFVTATPGDYRVVRRDLGLAYLVPGTFAPVFQQLFD